MIAASRGGAPSRRVAPDWSHLIVVSLRAGSSESADSVGSPLSLVTAPTARRERSVRRGPPSQDGETESRGASDAASVVIHRFTGHRLQVRRGWPRGAARLTPGERAGNSGRPGACGAPWCRSARFCDRCITQVPSATPATAAASAAAAEKAEIGSVAARAGHRARAHRSRRPASGHSGGAPDGCGRGHGCGCGRGGRRRRREDRVGVASHL